MDLKQFFYDTKIANFYRFIRLKLSRLKRPRFNDAYLYCRGEGIEIGALSVPYKFRKARVTYADIKTAAEMRKLIDDIPIPGLYLGKMVEPDIILSGPEYKFDNIKKNQFDFVYSSHVMEHHPNFLSAIKEQLRILKNDGILYAVVPNKCMMYDRLRETTPAQKLIERYENSIFTFDMEDALDVINNTIDHPHYVGKTEDDARKMLKEADGSHHYHTYDATNIIPALSYAQIEFNCELIYYRVEGVNIHFALKNKCLS